MSKKTNTTHQAWKDNQKRKQVDNFRDVLFKLADQFEHMEDTQNGAMLSKVVISLVPSEGECIFIAEATVKMRLVHTSQKFPRVD